MDKECEAANQRRRKLRYLKGRKTGRKRKRIQGEKRRGKTSESAEFKKVQEGERKGRGRNEKFSTARKSGNISHILKAFFVRHSSENETLDSDRKVIQNLYSQMRIHMVR